MTEKPVIAQYKPYRVTVEAGKRYLWCSCGKSQSQPFCDSSHVGSHFKPIPYRATDTRAVLFCGCKHSAAGPVCDGSHNNLTDEYAEDDRPIEDLLSDNREVPFDSRGRALLDGGCYVQRPSGLDWAHTGGLDVCSVMSSADGTKYIDQYCLRAEGSASDVLHFPGADVVLYCLVGGGSVDVAGKVFDIAPRAGLHVRAEEAFRLVPAPGEQLQCLVTVCPGGAQLLTVEQMPANFDGSFTERVVAYDESRRVSMADRFYQVLVGEQVGSGQVTQFIGQIPRSKAAPHRHLYEEAIVILSARGMMWTEKCRAAVEAGDLIFLPAEQEHSLQCTEEGGMELAGHFYPSGSPSINY